jgi:uncharacterized protein
MDHAAQGEKRCLSMASHRVALIGDTHLPRGARRLSEACLKRLHAADLILHAGDLVSLAFLDELEAIGVAVAAVHGNIDDPAVKALLPRECVVELAGKRLGMVHDGGAAAGREARLIKQFPDCAAIVYGHTHRPQVERRQGIWILNPGSPTERRKAQSRAMLELRVSRDKVVPRLIELDK